MLDRVADFIARHRMLSPALRVGLAVSGGADSVFLLHALRELAPRWDLHLSVIHIEHGIREAASLADAEFVSQLASTLGLPFHLHQADVPSIDGNLEQAARNLRQGFYSDLIACGAIDRVATGHTRTDQAETVLYRIVRGSGLAGLAGILPVTREGLIRPMLEIDRHEIEAWLRERGIPWREDATNHDRTYARNRLRHEILPLLRDGLNPQLDRALSHLADLARDEEAYWDAELLRQFPPRTGPGPVVLSVSQLRDAPPAFARRVIRCAIKTAKNYLCGIDFAHIERVLEMARAPDGHDRLQVPGVDICRSFDWIQMTPADAKPEASGFALKLQIPGTVELPASQARITLQVLEKDPAGQSPAGTRCVKVIDELDWQRFHNGDGAPSLELRNWRPGDQYRRAGHTKAEKVKFFFQEARVPLWERGNWPIITFHGQIVWAKRFGAAADFVAGPQASSVLQVSEARL